MASSDTRSKLAVKAELDIVQLGHLKDQLHDQLWTVLEKESPSDFDFRIATALRSFKGQISKEIAHLTAISSPARTKRSNRAKRTWAVQMKACEGQSGKARRPKKTEKKSKANKAKKALKVEEPSTLELKNRFAILAEMSDSDEFEMATSFSPVNVGGAKRKRDPETGCFLKGPAKPKAPKTKKTAAAKPKSNKNEKKAKKSSPIRRVESEGEVAVNDAENVANDAPIAPSAPSKYFSIFCGNSTKKAKLLKSESSGNEKKAAESSPIRCFESEGEDKFQAVLHEDSTMQNDAIEDESEDATIARHLPLEDLSVLIAAWDPRYDTVTENNFLSSLPVICYLKSVYEGLPADRKEKSGFLASDFFGPVVDGNRPQRSSLGFGYYGAETPEFLLATKSNLAHWTLFWIEVETGRTVQYDPLRNQESEGCNDEVRADVEKLQMAVAQAFGKRFPAEGTVEMPPAKAFGKALLQNDGYNCALYVLAVAEQIMKGGLFTTFDIHQYRCHVASIVNQTNSVALLNLTPTIAACPWSITRAHLPPSSSSSSLDAVRRRKRAPLRCDTQRENLRNMKRSYYEQLKSQLSSEEFTRTFNPQPKGTPRTEILEKKQLAEAKKLMLRLAETCSTGLMALLEQFENTADSLQLDSLHEAIVARQHRPERSRKEKTILNRMVAVRKIVKGTQKISELLDELLDKEKMTVSEYDELRLVEKLRDAAAPQTAAEAFTQIKRAGYLSERVSLIKEVALKKIEAVRRQVKNHLKYNVKQLPNSTDEQQMVRVLGRMRFHTRGPRDDVSDFVLMSKLYGQLHAEFMGTDCDVKPSTPLPATPSLKMSQLSLRDQVATPVTPVSRLLKSMSIQGHDKPEASGPNWGYANSEGGVVDHNNNIDNDSAIEIADNDEDDEVNEELQNAEAEVSKLLPAVVSALDADALQENNVDLDALNAEAGQQDMGDIAAAVFRSTTFIRRCSEKCLTVKDEDAPILRDLFGQLITSTEETSHLVAEQFEEFDAELHMTPKQWLNQHYNCYAGIRSLSKRLGEFTRHAEFLKRLNDGQREVDVTELTKLADGQDVPYAIWVEVCKNHYDHETELTAAGTWAKHGKTIDRFRHDITINETVSCDVCEQLNMKTVMAAMPVCDERPQRKAGRGKSMIPKEWLPEYLQNAAEVQICKRCRDSVIDLKMPNNAVENGNATEDVPEELQDLNWIEDCLIQLIRPVQKTFHLTDQGGRKTGIKASKGAMVLLPVPLNSTVDHLAKTLQLPSTNGLKIMVDNPFDKKLINLEKVLRALRYLQINHAEYRTDVVINESFTFTKDSVIFEKPAAQDVYDALIARNEEDNEHLLTQAEFVAQPIISNTGAPPPLTTTSEYAYQEYTLKKHAYQPIRLSDAKHADVKCFPWLFPSGRFGYDYWRPNDVAMKRSMTRRAVFKHKLRNKNRNFARSSHFITMAHGTLVQQDITSCLGINARLKKGQLLAAEVKKMISEKDEHFAQLTSPKLQDLRGTAPYWQSVKLDVKAHIGILGPPTFFVTLNPSEENWPEVHQAYADVYNLPIADVEKNIKQLIADDPYIWTRCVQRRYRMFIKHFLGNGKGEEEGPLGKVIHYFGRIEYQKRGTEHMHMLIWTKDAPGKDASDEERIAFIDKYITARMPDEVTESELFGLIKQHQMHWDTHTPTCRRLVKHRNKTFTTCRFEFPRPVVGRTVVNKSAHITRRVPGSKTKPYSLARRRGQDEWVNDYNPALTLAWRANTDVQYIMSDVLDVVNYITGYTTKHESSKGASALDDLRNAAASSKDMFKTIIDLINQRECGTLELCDLIMGHPLYFFDAGHKFINTNSSEKRSRALKSAADLENVQDGENAYKDNLVDTYYPNRSTELEDFSLFNVIVHFDVVCSSSTLRNRQKDKVKRKTAKKSTRAPASDEEDEDEQQESGSDDEEEDTSKKKSIFRHQFHVNKRSSPFYCHKDVEIGKCFEITGIQEKAFRKRTAHVPRVFWPNLLLDDETVVEDYYRRLSMMFIPWRNEESDVLGCRSLEKRWKAFIDELERNGDVEALADINKFIDLQNQRAEMDRIVGQRRAEERKALQEENIELDAAEELVTYDRHVDVPLHDKNVEGLNNTQQEIFTSVTEHVKKQHEDPAEGALRLFVTGTAGTGKSYLIGTLADELTIKYTTTENRAFRPAVLIAAPTGLAAVQIKGSTIHSLFGIGVQKGRKQGFEALDLRKLNLKRTLFQNVKLIIIDELSMCSNVLLAKIHARLEEIFPGTGQPFGNRNIISFGDLMQLPPVLASPVFIPLSRKDILKTFNSIAPPFELWTLFDYKELTENMRQKDDLEFANLMGRMRVGALNEDDTEKLFSRVIDVDGKPMSLGEAASYFVTKHRADPFTMALFSLNETVHAFNRLVIEELNLQHVKIVAEDSDARVRNTKRKRIYQRKEYQLEERFNRPILPVDDDDLDDKEMESKTGGMPKNLLLAVNGRVMLRRTIDGAKGLVNGATGVLKRLLETTTGYVDALEIEFDRGIGLVVVKRASAIFETGLDTRVTRSQFPVVLSFGATIHKCQGLTLQTAMVSTNEIFTHAQAYVAMSRVTNIEGLHLIDYAPAAVKVCRKSLTEYNRLRETVGLEQFALPPAPQERRPAADKPLNVSHAVQIRKRTSRTSTKAATPKPVTPKATQVDESEGSGEEEDEPRRKMRAVFADEDDDFPRIVNSGTDCFLIVCCQVFYRMDAVATRLSTGPYANRFVELLGQVIRKETRSVVNLRRLLPERFHRGLQNSSACFEEIVGSFFDFDLRSSFSFNVHTSRVCLCGHRSRVEKDRTHLGFSTLQIYAPSVPFMSLLSDYLENRQLCATCQTEKVTTRTIDFDEDTIENLILIFHNRETPPNITGMNPSGVQMFGYTWKPIAGIEFIPRIKHYVAWSKTRAEGGTVWYVLDDDNIPTPKSMLKQGIKNFELVCLEKVARYVPRATGTSTPRRAGNKRKATRKTL